MSNSVATLVAACVLLTALGFAGCTGEEAGNSNAAAKPSPDGAAVANANQKAVPNVQRPLGREDTIEGRVVAILCLRDMPKASPDELAKCSKEKVAQGGALALLASDGNVYIDDRDVTVTNNNLRAFVGDDVTIQGQQATDESTISLPNVSVKKFHMVLVKRKGVDPNTKPANRGVVSKPTPRKA